VEWLSIEAGFANWPLVYAIAGGAALLAYELLRTPLARSSQTTHSKCFGE
jgi:hypothetical protein